MHCVFVNVDNYSSKDAIKVLYNEVNKRDKLYHIALSKFAMEKKKYLFALRNAQIETYC